jgi:hypothetical protein
VCLLQAEGSSRSEAKLEVQAGACAPRIDRSAVPADVLANLARRRPLEVGTKDSAQVRHVVANDVLAVNLNTAVKYVLAGCFMSAGTPSGGHEGSRGNAGRR